MLKIVHYDHIIINAIKYVKTSKKLLKVEDRFYAKLLLFFCLKKHMNIYVVYSYSNYKIQIMLEIFWIQSFSVIQCFMELRGSEALLRMELSVFSQLTDPKPKLFSNYALKMLMFIVCVMLIML